MSEHDAVVRSHTVDLLGPAALVLAHPGHALRLYHWLRLVHPRVLVLTDGSGASARSRIACASSTLAETGGRQGSILGRFGDRQIYSEIIAGNVALFVQVAEALHRDSIHCVAGDAVGGSNPAHDLCRLIINASVPLWRHAERAGP